MVRMETRLHYWSSSVSLALCGALQCTHMEKTATTGGTKKPCVFPG